MAVQIDHEQLEALTQDLMRAIAGPLDRPPDPSNVVMVIAGLAFVTGAVLSASNDCHLHSLYQMLLRAFIADKDEHPLH